MIIKRTKNFSRAISKTEEMIEIKKRLSDKGPITKGIYKLFKLTPVREKDGSFSRLRSSSIDREVNLNDLRKGILDNRKFWNKAAKELDQKYGYQYSK